MTKITPLFQRPLPRSYFYGSLGIIVINLVAFLLVLIDFNNLEWMGLHPIVLSDGSWWRLLTYMYAQFDTTHLLFNILGLVFFGLAVEEEMGSWEFLLFYHVTGVLAGLTWLGISGLVGANTYLLGASAAVYAVELAFAAYRPHARILLLFFPIRARNLIIILVSFQVFSEFFNPYGSVSYLAHLAGFLFSFLYLLIRLRINAWTRFWE